MRKETVKRYHDEIDLFVRTVKRRLSDTDCSLNREELAAIVEDIFFSSKVIDSVQAGDVAEVIRSVLMRVSSRYGILAGPLEDPDVNEIMVNGPHHIFIEKNGAVLPYDDAFTDAHELEDIIRMFASDVHREINEANPIVDARLPSGYRVNGVLSNVAINGPILTIRKFSEQEISLTDLIHYGSVSVECIDLLVDLVRAGYNIFISGGTSSGKTTFLNALTQVIDTRERVIIIEDSAELRIEHLANKVQMECRNANSIGKGEVTMDKLIKTSLRMRPDRIIVGEVRGREVIDMIQAMSTGHDGSMSTGHGNSIRGMLGRLETMYLMDQGIPIYAIRSQIANAIDVVVHLKRRSDGSRGVVEVAELAGFDGNDYELNYLFQTSDENGLRSTGNELIHQDKLRRYRNAVQLR
ncbi:MAG: CpaF family protein [Mogibacterium sp.]|nr:CpaF family protein [Mogibacterium sp.]